jgi:hypothetical protein
MKDRAGRVVALHHLQSQGRHSVWGMQDHRQARPSRRLHQDLQESLALTCLLLGHALIEQSVMRQADFPYGDYVATVVLNLFQHRLHLRPRCIETLRMQA